MQLPPSQEVHNITDWRGSSQGSLRCWISIRSMSVWESKSAVTAVQSLGLVALNRHFEHGRPFGAKRHLARCNFPSCVG